MKKLAAVTSLGKVNNYGAETFTMVITITMATVGVIAMAKLGEMAI